MARTSEKKWSKTQNTRNLLAEARGGAGGTRAPGEPVSRHYLAFAVSPGNLKRTLSSE